MDKEFYKRCIKIEVYKSYKEAPLSLVDKIWCRYFRPEFNSFFLIRRYLYRVHKKGINKMLAKFDYVRLMRRYGIFASSGASIDIGLRFVHPTGIIITSAAIGKHLTLFQNVIIDMQKNARVGSKAVPNIGDNVIVYANASIIGKVSVADGSVIGAHSVLLDNAYEKGIYCGIPAKLKRHLAQEVNNDIHL